MGATTSAGPSGPAGPRISQANENRAKAMEQGLTFPVVLQNQWEVSRDYAFFATAVAYLIAEARTIAADITVGVERHSRLDAPRPANAPTRSQKGETLPGPTPGNWFPCTTSDLLVDRLNQRVGPNSVRAKQ